MTTTTLSDSDISAKYAGCSNLKEVIDSLEEEFANRGEVICEIRVNGMLLDEKDEAAFAANPVAGIHSLSIQSQRPSKLIGDAIQSALSFIPELEKQALTAAEALRGVGGKQDVSLFISTVEGCQWLVDTIVHLRGAAHGIGQPISQPEKWYNAEKLLASVVAQVSEAYANSDMVLVADIFEYELTAAIQLWSEALAEEATRR